MKRMNTAKHFKNDVQKYILKVLNYQNPTRDHLFLLMGNEFADYISKDAGKEIAAAYDELLNLGTIYEQSGYVYSDPGSL